MGAPTVVNGNPRAHRQSRKCRTVAKVGNTAIEGIIDTGASGGNCIDYTVFSALPKEKYHILSVTPSVCVGINKVPVRIIGKILLEFSLEDENASNNCVTFREEFNVIEHLVHPIVIGLPFLQKHKAILSFEKDEIYIGQFKFPLGRAPNVTELPPPTYGGFSRDYHPSSIKNIHSNISHRQSRFV